MFTITPLTVKTNEVKGIAYFNALGYQFYLKHFHERAWFKQLQRSNFFHDAKRFLIDLNKNRNDGKLICDFCRQEILNPLLNCNVYYVYRPPFPEQLFNPDHNMLVHKNPCFKQLINLKGYEVTREKW